MPVAPSPPPDQVLKTIRIIVLAMMMGVGLFAVVAVVMGPAGSPPPPGAPTPRTNPDPAVFLGLTLALSVAAVVGNLVAVRFAQRQATAAWSAGGAEAVVRVLMSTSVLRAALAESAGLMGCITVFLTGNLVGLVGVAVAGVLMGALLPVEARMAALTRRASGERFGM